MKTIVKLSDDRLPIAEFAQLMSSSLDVIDEASIPLGEDEMVLGLIAKLRQLTPQLEATLKQKRGSVLTQSLREAQEMRQLDLQALFNSVKIYRATRQQEKKEAYMVLNSLFLHYKEVKTANTEKSLALVKSLLSKLETEPYASHAKLLGIDDCLKNLQESQASFYQLYLKRSQEVDHQVTIASQSIRKELHTHYNLLYSHLSNQFRYDSQSSYKGLLQALTDIRSEYVDLLKRRKTLALKKINAQKGETSVDKEPLLTED